MVGPDTAALVAGSEATAEDHVAATNRALAILTPADVSLIHTACLRVRRLDERAYRAAVDRALADARRTQQDRDRRRLHPVSDGPRYKGLHIHT